MTGSVRNRPKSGRIQSATDEEHALDVLQTSIEDPHTSLRKAAQQHDMHPMSQDGAPPHYGRQRTIQSSSRIYTRPVGGQVTWSRQPEASNLPRVDDHTCKSQASCLSTCLVGRLARGVDNLPSHHSKTVPATQPALH
ncbi:hypothetical protein J6590_058630 [Homalodisca vitripennis]|nr:hypothetical protein J6590_058630 [Homalodisca vitripennis]